jgi:hypothetical protein
MKTKNISVCIKKDEKIPFKETYTVFSDSNEKVRIDQKFVDSTKNQSISLNKEECKRLINLLNFYMFNGKFNPYKDKMLVFEQD